MGLLDFLKAVAEKAKARKKKVRGASGSTNPLTKGKPTFWTVCEGRTAFQNKLAKDLLACGPGPAKKL